jgi:hypothetical protein
LTIVHEHCWWKGGNLLIYYHYYKLHPIPLLQTTQLAIEGKHHHGTTSWVDLTIHFHFSSCSWITFLFVCQWRPKSAMVELDKIHVWFYKTPKKNQLFFMLSNNNTFIIEEKLCACKFMFETTMSNSNSSAVWSLSMSWIWMLHNGNAQCLMELHNA